MTNAANDNLTGPQARHVEGSRLQVFTDVHCHCLPGFDDGPATTAESLDLCRKLSEEGIAVAVATPHQLGRFDGRNDAAKVREAAGRLNEILQDKNIALEVVPGAEVRVDERICRLLEADKILTLADGGKYLLVELPHQVFVDIDPLLRELTCRGISTIISHPEKNAPLARQPDALRKWLEHGASTQVTTYSLTGAYGPHIRRAAWLLLAAGWVGLVATDAHGAERGRPRVKAVFELIARRLGGGLAQLVCIENPARVVNGQDLLPVPASNLREVNW